MKAEQFIISFFPIVIFFSMLLFIHALRRWNHGNRENSFHILAVTSGSDLNTPPPALQCRCHHHQMTSRKESSDRREHPREALNTFVDFVYKGALVKTASKDFSQSGMYIRVDGSGRFMKNGQLTLVCQKPDGNNFKSSARIARIDDDGIGVEFMAA